MSHTIPKLNFLGETWVDVQLSAGIYPDGTPAIQLFDPNEGPLTTATISLAAYGRYPRPGFVFIRDYDANAGLYAALLEAGVIEPGKRIDVRGPHSILTVFETKLTPEFSFDDSEDEK